jgi:hypothetical protein
MNRLIALTQNTFFVCLVGILLFSCSSLDTEPIAVKTKLQERFTFAVGEIAEVQDESLRARLDSVPEDSRCPQNTACVWAGNARIRITMTKSGAQKQQLELNTDTEPKVASYLGYRVQLVQLTPLPIAGQATKPGDYRAVVVISKQ